MLTSNFKYFEFPFKKFNKAQYSVIPYIEKDVNLVISFPTAIGKTAIAECIFAYHLQKSNNLKCVYISPYKALSYQKYDSWNNNKQFSEYGVLINTGELQSSSEDLKNCGRLLLLTTESFDSKTRNFEIHKWLNLVDVLVVDEAHLIGNSGRGDKIESSLMRFTNINKNARIILLSATMSNIIEISSWIKSLNNKDTIKFHTNWRPTKIISKFHTFENNGFKSWEKKKEIVFEIINNVEFGEKVVVFVHSKKFGRELVQFIRKKGIRCCFHNASLSSKDRHKIELMFSDQYSGLDVIISTSTLSSGVNI